LRGVHPASRQRQCLLDVPGEVMANAAAAIEIAADLAFLALQCAGQVALVGVAAGQKLQVGVADSEGIHNAMLCRHCWAVNDAAR